MPPDGIVLVDKPAGKTSHEMVAGLRRHHRGAKVGHAGTLDPFATGLLIVLVGRATRAQRFFMALPKAYRVLARLGAVSSTGDPEGEIVLTGVQPPDPLSLPVGPVRQRPPAHSAVKLAGERAYRRARRGEEVELPERVVTVHRFELVWRDAERAELEVECSSGTYVRSLVADLGDAFCEQLRRTAIGPFRVGDADPDRVIGLDEGLAFLPEVRLDGDAARGAAHGRAVAGRAGGAVRLTDAEGLIAVAEPVAAAGEGEPELLKPVVGFRGR